MRGFRGIALGVLIAAAAGAFIFWIFGEPVTAESIDLDQTGPRIVALSTLCFVFVASLLFGQPRVGDILRGTFFWGGLALLLVTGYAYRTDLVSAGYRVLGSLAPGLAVNQEDGSILIVRDRSGHFQLDSQVNGHPVHFMLDTGATTVVLTHEDAITAGLNPDELSYSVQVQTANGRAMVAPVYLDEITVGSFRLTDVRALVAHQGALGTSLFGMTALDRLKSWRIEGDKLILVP